MICKPLRNCFGAALQFQKLLYRLDETRSPPTSRSSRWDSCPVSAGPAIVKRGSTKLSACALHVLLRAARTEKGGAQMLEGYDDLLTSEEACEALKIGKNALYELLASGTLKAYRNGRVWRVPKAAIEAYIRAQAGM